MSHTRRPSRVTTIALVVGLLACSESSLGPTLAQWGGPNGFSFKRYANGVIFAYACIAPLTADPLTTDSVGRFRLGIRTQGFGPTVVLVGRVAGDTIFAGLSTTPANDTLPSVAFGLRNQPPGPINALCIHDPPAARPN